jgi:hypothetical protein
MSNPSTAGLRILIAIAALALVTAIAAPVASGDEACAVPSSSTSTSSTSSSESMSSTSSTAMSSMSANLPGGPGSGAASSLTQDAWLVKGDPAGDDVSMIHGIVTFGVHAAGSQTASSAGFDYGIARLHDPSDNSSYEIRLTGIDSSPDIKYGGVAFLKPAFGNTGVGPASISQTVAYIAAFGRADILKNGQQIASNVPMHLVVTPGIRDTSTGKMLASLDYGAREIFLHVPGPIQGLPDGSLTVGWNSSSLDLRDVGGRLMTQRQVAMAILPGQATAVAGVTAEVPLGAIRLSLRNDGFRSTMPETFTAGFTTITVVNNSSRPRGVIIKAKDVIGASTVRYTPVLRPGQAYKFYTYLGPGAFTAMDYHGMTRGMRHWRTNYQTHFSIGE